MVFERNLNGIEVILRIDNYESPSKHTFGDWWCDCGFSFRMGKLAEIINYRKDHDELLTPEEVDGLADALTNLLEGKINELQEYPLVEPDFVFLLYPIKDLRTDPKYTYVAPGHEFQDIYVEWRVFFWDDGLTENYLNVTLYLKEAFRYQNKLQSFMDEAHGILERDANVTKVENTYLRHKVMAEAEDETVLIAPETEYYEQITDIAKFLLYLLGEKDKLFAAIRKAKDALDIDMDSEVSLNATRQSIAHTFKRMNDLRNSEQTISNGGTGYRFNAEGNQISYRCDVKRVTTINYDRNVIRTELGKLNKQADETSTKIDLCLVTSKVDYEPPFDVNSSFAEAFEAYTENARA